MAKTIEELVETYENADIEVESLNGQIETLRHAQEVLGEEIGKQIQKMGLDGMTTKNKYRIDVRENISVAGVEMSVARELGATKMQETKDLNKLRELYKQGTKIKGIISKIRIFVKEAK